MLARTFFYSLALSLACAVAPAFAGENGPVAKKATIEALGPVLYRDAAGQYRRYSEEGYFTSLGWSGGFARRPIRDGLFSRRYNSLDRVVARLGAASEGGYEARDGRDRREARTVVEVILNEMAGSAMVGTTHAMQDAIYIASVIANRATASGLSPQEVVSVQREFNGYGIPLRRGAEKDLNLAQKALEFVARYGPVHEAMYYATPAWADNLPDGLELEAQTEGHVYFSDPLARSYKTAVGYVRPDPHVTFEFLLALLATNDAPLPTRRPLLSLNRRFR